jgi:hypothetical protein
MKKILVSLAAASLLVLSSAVGAAKASTASWYVAPAGSDANSCVDPAQPCATINGAIGKASAGDTVKVAVGTYTGSGNEVVLVDESVTLEGGWNADFTSRAGVSTVDGQGARQGIQVANAAARIARFVIENGSGGFGFVAAAAGQPGTPPALAWSPSTHYYGTIDADDTASQAFTLTNSGGSASGC